MTANETTTWDEIRRIADQLELEIHLAGMEARDRWKALQPKLAELERTIDRAGKRAGEALGEQLSTVAQTLRELRADVAKHQHDTHRS